VFSGKNPSNWVKRRYEASQIALAVLVFLLEGGPERKGEEAEYKHAKLTENPTDVVAEIPTIVSILLECLLNLSPLVHPF
jgi:hypothetical protein